MIEAEFGHRKLFTTILASIVIAGKNVLAVELDGLLGKLIVLGQTNNSGNLDFARNSANPIIFFFSKKLGTVLTHLEPTRKIISRILPILGANNLSLFFHQKDECPSDINDLNSHEHLVQDKYTGIKRAG